jgi:hypothetical protein
MRGSPPANRSAACERTNTQLQLRGGYNRNAVRLILGEVQPDHGQAAVDDLIGELGLEAAFGLKPGTDFSGTGR